MESKEQIDMFEENETTNTLKIQTMNPGILVGEQCQLFGGVHYLRHDHKTEETGNRVKRQYSSVVTVMDKEERAEGEKLRNYAKNALRKICADTSVGLICPASKMEELANVVQDIKSKADSFNITSQYSHLVTRYAFYSVDQANQGALAAITDLVADVAKRVEEAIYKSDQQVLRGAPRRWMKNLEVDQVLALPTEQKEAIVARVRAQRIREALLETKNIGSLLNEQAGVAVRQMVTEAKKIAKDLCRKVEKKHESVENVLSEVDLSGISKTRATFVLAAMEADKKVAQSLVQPKIEARAIMIED